ncbi:MAG: hypothetical protein M0P69_13835 [Bacteroidales bacterium]|nr:hypothetical protein [Bacteroidales bacterium]
MGKILPVYVMDCGVSVDNSYWIPTQVVIDKMEKHVQIIMTGFRDYESRMTGQNVVGSVVYHLWGVDATNYINNSIAVDMNSLAYAYEYVSATSIPVKKGINGEIERKSLFDGATDLQEELPVTEEEEDTEDEESSLEVIDDGTACGEVETGEEVTPVTEGSATETDDDVATDQELKELLQEFTGLDEEIPDDDVVEEVSEEVVEEVVDETESSVEGITKYVITDETEAIVSDDTAVGDSSAEVSAEGDITVDEGGTAETEQYWES